jgi:putative SOS response-associated peptidase YedK
MCGRYSFTASKEKLNKHFGLSLKEDLDKSYNIAPTHNAYVLTNDEPKKLRKLRWGLIPYWSKPETRSSNLINARSETIATKVSFRMPIRKKRCLVLADGFYEWKTYGGKKIPHRIVMKETGKMMAFAGVWDEYINTKGEKVESFSVITTTPNKEMELVHDRMPVILPTIELQQQWLAELPLNKVLELLKPIGNDTLRIYPVSDKLNKVGYNESDLFNEVKTPPTLFDFT